MICSPCSQNYSCFDFRISAELFQDHNTQEQVRKDKKHKPTNNQSSYVGLT